MVLRTYLVKRDAEIVQLDFGNESLPDRTRCDGTFFIIIIIIIIITNDRAIVRWIPCERALSAPRTSDFFRTKLPWHVHQRRVQYNFYNVVVVRFETIRMKCRLRVHSLVKCPIMTGLNSFTTSKIWNDCAVHENRDTCSDVWFFAVNRYWGLSEIGVLEF